MSLKKWLIQLNNKLEKKWQDVPLNHKPPTVESGWYLSEYTQTGNADSTPRLLIDDHDGARRERLLFGAHAGRNRTLFYLPGGKFIAHSESISMTRLARVSAVEARFRTFLICLRYLRDFFGPRALFKMIHLQFLDPFDRSTELLKFYTPHVQNSGYLKDVEVWRRLDAYPKIAKWLAGDVKIAVVIEDEEQRAELKGLLIAPDQVALAHSGETIDADIDFVIPLQRSERLRFASLMIIKRWLRKCKTHPEFVYTDHDYNDAELTLRMAPAFKPQPSLAYLACFNFVGPAVILSSKITRDVELTALLEDRTIYSLALKSFENTSRVSHIPEALFVSRRTKTPDTPKPFARDYDWGELNWKRRGDYNVLVAKEASSSSPSVDLIIPTRDGMQVLKPCVDGILEKTKYPNYQIIIVDNGSEKQETLDYFAELKSDPRVSVVHYPGEFNYSAINNFAVSHGSSDYIGLINNDIEVIDGDWLTQMMAWAVKPSVGIVGAKLLFSDGRVQHAGVTIGMGNAAGHIHRLEDRDAPGYQLRCLATQNMMAVTAACLITPREIYDRLNGLNEKDFRVAYNDIDYCLRVEESGLQVIWTPEAILFHHESVSRGDDMSDQHIQRYFKELKALQSRWKTKGFVDKYYSKHLRISDEGVYPKIDSQQQEKLTYLLEQ